MNLLLISLLLISALVGAAELLQYPETREYDSSDVGFNKYKAPSMYQSNNYALTYDDGPHALHTPKILDLLKAHQAKATFFVITNRINNSTLPLIKRMIKEGHIVASHGLTHDNSNQLSADNFRKNLKESLLKIRKIYKDVGEDFNSVYYRFPYADYGRRRDYHHMNIMQSVSRELFGDNCIQFAFWDIDSADWLESLTGHDIFTTLKSFQNGGKFYSFKATTQNGQRVYNKVILNQKKPTKGGVILLHDIHARSVEATKLFLEFVKKERLNIVNLPEVDEFAVNPRCRFL